MKMQAIYFDNVRELLSNGCSDFCENFSVKAKTKAAEAPWQIYLQMIMLIILKVENDTNCDCKTAVIARYC